MEAPSGFTLRSVLGIFEMEPDGRIYRGSSNGFDVEASLTEKGWDVTLRSEAGKWASCETSALIPVCGEGFERSVALWIDSVCPETVEDYEDDVRFLDTGKGRIAYYAYNTNLDTIPVVFVHGGPGGDSNPVKARRLRLNHPVYAYDQMGCGRSDPIKDIGNWKLDDYVDELIRFIDHIGAEKVILIGASWGAGLCAAYAQRTRCAKIDCMVLPSPFLSSAAWAEDQMENLREMSPEMYDDMRKCIAENDLGPRFKQIMGEYYARYLFCRSCFREIALANADELFNEVFLTLWGPNDMVCTGTLRDFDVIPGLKDIDVPVLFMCGDSDEVTVPRMVDYRRMVKGSRLSIIPYAGHVTAMEQFELYRESIAAFLREIGHKD